jgi:hypothetical protein
MRATVVEGVKCREWADLQASALLRKDTYVVRRNEFAVSFVMLSLRILTALSRLYRLEFVSRFTLKRHGALQLRKWKQSIVFLEEQT